MSTRWVQAATPRISAAEVVFVAHGSSLCAQEHHSLLSEFVDASDPNRRRNVMNGACRQDEPCVRHHRFSAVMSTVVVA